MVAKDQDLTILRTTCSHKSVQLVADEGGGLSERPVDEYKQDALCLSPEQVKTLAGYAVNTGETLRVSSGYRMGPRSPWTPARAANAASPSGEAVEKERLKKFPRVEGYSVLVEAGAVAFPGVGSGPAFHVRSDEDLAAFPGGRCAHCQAFLTAICHRDAKSPGYRD